MRGKLMVALLLIVFTELGFGCARTVTSVITYGNTLSVTVTFADDLDITNNTYYMVISSQEAYQLPYDPYEPYEFIEPGIPPATSDPVQDYYAYYQTWDGYIILGGKDNGIYLVDGPFTSSAESYSDYTRIKLGTFSGSTNEWTFNFDLTDLYATSEVPASLYFDLVSVNNLTNILRDHLDDGTYISSYSDSTDSGYDDEDSELDGSLDILSYSATIN